MAYYLQEFLRSAEEFDVRNVYNPIRFAILFETHPGIFDTIDFFDHKANKRDSLRGNIDKEGPAGIRVKQRTDVRDIPAADILQILYASTSVPALTFRAPFGKEERALAPGTRPDQRKQLLDEF